MADTAQKASAPGKTRGANINLSDYGLLAALVVVVMLFQWGTGGKLLNPGNVNNLIMQNAYVVILAIGMIMVIIAGHIDLSVGAGVAMIGGFVALAIMDWKMPWPLAVLLALIFGAIMGAWQGYWVAFVGIPGFITTLSGMLAFRGLALIILTRGTIGGLPEGFIAIGARWMPSWLGHWLNNRDGLTLVFGLVAVLAMVGSQLRTRRKLKARSLPREARSLFVVKNAVVGVAIMYLAYVIAGQVIVTNGVASPSKGMPYILIILALLVVAYTFVLNRTVFGRHIYAMGGNRFAAIMSGVKTKWVDFYIFVNMGVLTALAAIVSTARAGGAVADAGNFFELDAIAACFIGGTSVYGGVGKISGAVTGAFLIGVINQGLSIMGIDPAWQKVIKGLVLIAAVAFDLINRRKAGNA